VSAFAAGVRNIAGGLGASVAGGTNNAASGDFSSVTGGTGNFAGGDSSSISGGQGNMTTAVASSVSGGRGNFANGLNASVTGGGAREERSGAVRYVSFRITCIFCSVAARDRREVRIANLDGHGARAQPLPAQGGRELPGHALELARHLLKVGQVPGVGLLAGDRLVGPV